MPVVPSDLPSRLGVVVVNYGSHRLIESNLGALANGLSDFVAVVVDNFTTSEEASAIAQTCKRSGWVLVANETNVGFGAAMNIGLDAACNLGADILLMINPDASISSQGVEELVRLVRADSTIMVSPTILRPDGETWFGGGSVLVAQGLTTTRAGSDSTAPNGWLTGACLAVQTSLWSKIGGFDEDYFLYWEDVDLSWRCVAAGGALVVASDILATHTVGGTQSSLGKSSLYVFYNCRNRLVFASKHLNSRDQKRWLWVSGRYARSVILRGGRKNFVRRPLRLVAAAVGGTASGAWYLLRHAA